MHANRRTFLKHAALSLGVAASLRRAASADEPKAQTDSPVDPFAALEAFVKAGIDDHTYPGAAVQASLAGRPIYGKQWGTWCSHTRVDEPLDEKVIHPLFSFSKLVSATVVAMLHQDGVLDYAAPACQYIPEFTGGGKEKITIRHLLSHAAGIPSVPLGPVATDDQWTAAVKAVCEAPTAWEPGSRCEYHGLTGLFVCAEAARRKTGQPWHALCKERLFDPLGTAEMTFVLPQPPRSLALVPQPKPDVLAKVQAEYGLHYNVWLTGHPAGGCFGTLADMLRVLELHLADGVWQGQILIKPATLRELHTVQYEAQIAQALSEGKPPLHQTWGLGPLMRGAHPADGAHGWFGFRDQASPGIFGHAGISTVIGVADPATGLALAFATTDAPNPESRATDIRCGVTNHLFEAAATSTGASKE